jgi:predicted chitinase
MSGGSVGSSIKGAISDRMQASVVGLKEKFDPLNIASKLTGGSRIGPALLGRMTGRSKEDIDYFAHNRRVHRFDNVMNKGQGSGDSRKSIEVLENIYSFMVKTRESQIKDNHSTFKFENERQQSNQRRHDEVMNVFSEATKRNRQAVGVIARPKAVEKPPEAPPSAPPAPPKPGVSPKPEPAKPAPPSAPAPTPAAKPTPAPAPTPAVKPTPTPAPTPAVKPTPAPAPTPAAKPTLPAPAAPKPTPPKPIETAKPVTKVEPAPPSAAPAPPAVKPTPSAAPVKPAITEVAKTATKLTGPSVAIAGILVAGGIVSPKAQANVLAQIEAESGFVPKSEDMNYSPEGLVQLRPKLFSDDGTKKGKPNNLAISLGYNKQTGKKADQEQIANLAYGSPGNDRGNTQPGDGWKYRGRGLIQITGRGAYEAFKKHSGIDVVNNPDLMNTPEVAAKAVPWFLLKYKSYIIKKPEDLEDISKVNRAIGFQDHIISKGEFKGKTESAKREILANRLGEKVAEGSIENSDMKKSLSEQLKPQQVAINNTTNVLNRETTVSASSDKGSDNPQFKRA